MLKCLQTIEEEKYGLTIKTMIFVKQLEKGKKESKESALLFMLKMFSLNFVVD